jgi:hypothetical protein
MYMLLEWGGMYMLLERGVRNVAPIKSRLAARWCFLTKICSRLQERSVRGLTVLFEEEGRASLLLFKCSDPLHSEVMSFRVR